VLKEHVGPLFFALSSLTSLLLINYVAKQIGSMVGKGIPMKVIGQFFVLSIPFTVAMTFPMAVLVAVLYAFSRLAAENEVTGMKASGVSLARLLVPVLIGGFGIALFMLAFNDQVLPRSNHKLATLQSDIFRKKPTVALHERQMNEVSPGRLYLRTQRIDVGSSRIHDVEIHDMSDQALRRTVYADSGDILLTEDQRDLVMDLYNGEVFEVSQLQPTVLRHMYFESNRTIVHGVGDTLQLSEGSTFKSDRERTICDMQTEFEQEESKFYTAKASLKQLAKPPGAADAMTPGPEPASTATVLAHTDTTTPVYRPPPRLGHGYCAFVASIERLMGKVGDKMSPPPVSAATLPHTELRVASAQSQEQGAQPPQGKPVPQSTPVSTTVDSGTVAPQTAKQPPPSIQESYVGLAAVARQIMDESRKTMFRLGVEIEKKFALAAACFVFVLVGAPIALRFPRSGVGLVIGVSIAVFGIYYVGLIAGETLADDMKVLPWVSMWAPNIAFTILGLAMLSRMGRESATRNVRSPRDVWDAVRARFVRRPPPADALQPARPEAT
jgi:lipopolysaccharide export system permease protein